MERTRRAEISELVGKTLTEIHQVETEYHEERIYFVTSDGEKYKMYHEQGCCEGVRIESVDGDLNDLIGHPLEIAEESSNSKDTYWGSETWTFYRFATIKGYVTIRWHGESNGYYSESVDFVKVVSND